MIKGYDYQKVEASSKEDNIGGGVFKDTTRANILVAYQWCPTISAVAVS